MFRCNAARWEAGALRSSVAPRAAPVSNVLCNSRPDACLCLLVCRAAPMKVARFVFGLSPPTAPHRGRGCAARSPCRRTPLQSTGTAARELAWPRACAELTPLLRLSCFAACLQATAGRFWPAPATTAPCAYGTWPHWAPTCRCRRCVHMDLSSPPSPLRPTLRRYCAPPTWLAACVCGTHAAPGGRRSSCAWPRLRLLPRFLQDARRCC